MKAVSKKTISLIAVVVILLDQITKMIARGPLLEKGPFSFLDGWVHFETYENPGAFLSLGADWSSGARRWVFQLGVVLTLAYIFWLFRKKNWDIKASIGLALIWSGGFGNLIDRLWKESVTDFLVLGQGLLRTGVFNIADFVIILGLLFVLLGKETSTASAQPPQA